MLVFPGSALPVSGQPIALINYLAAPGQVTPTAVSQPSAVLVRCPSTISPSGRFTGRDILGVVWAGTFYSVTDFITFIVGLGHPQNLALAILNSLPVAMHGSPSLTNRASPGPARCLRTNQSIRQYIADGIDTVTLATIPRLALHNGDNYRLKVSMFAVNPGIADVSLSVRIELVAEGPVFGPAYPGAVIVALPGALATDNFAELDLGLQITMVDAGQVDYRLDAHRAASDVSGTTFPPNILIPQGNNIGFAAAGVAANLSLRASYAMVGVTAPGTAFTIWQEQVTFEPADEAA